jgi:hypothetical protein
MSDVLTADCVSVFILYYDAEFTLAQNSLYFRNVGAFPTFARLNGIAEAFGSWWQSEIQTALSDDIHLSTVGAIDQSGVTFDVGFHLPTAPNHGLGGAGMPLTVTCRIDFKTGVPGRSFHGCNYVSGLPKSRVTNGTIQTGFADGLRDAYESVFGVAGSVDLEWVILSRSTAGAPRAAGLMTPVTSVVLDDYTVDSWRSRAPNRHGNE